MSAGSASLSSVGVDKGTTPSNRLINCKDRKKGTCLKSKVGLRRPQLTETENI
jgi:hypothetical protein